MNGKAIIDHIKTNVKELQYWEIVTRLLEHTLTRKGEHIVIQNLRNTNGTGIDGIDETIAHLEADGFYVSITQQVTRPLTTAFGTIDVVDYTTIKVSTLPFPTTKYVGSVSDIFINEPLTNK